MVEGKVGICWEADRRRKSITAGFTGGPAARIEVQILGKHPCLPPGERRSRVLDMYCFSLAMGGTLKQSWKWRKRMLIMVPKF